MNQIVSLSTHHPAGLVGVGGETVRLTWSIDAPNAAVQTAYEIEAASDIDFDDVTARRTETSADQVAVLAPGAPPRSRETRFHRVRAEIDGEWTDWSAPVTTEVGLLHADDWTGSFITLPDDPGAVQMSPTPLLRREFDIAGDIASARLYVTSFGVHDVYLNGNRVSDHLLAPGWQTYGQRLVAVTHDVTELVRSGINAIGAELGDGWYRGRLGWSPGEDRRRYGDEVGLLAQLEVVTTDGAITTIASDGSWRAGTGAVRFADIYDGCLIDLRLERPGWTSSGFDDGDWVAVRRLDADVGIIEPWISAPVRPIADLDVELSTAPGGATRVDVGQNISGHLAIEVRGKAGDRIVTHHAEVLEPDGSLHLTSLRSAKASDEFVIADGETVTLVPAFTFHGFRYADITTAADVVSVRAIAISSDLEPRSSFESNHAGLTQLVSNVRWSQRDNFVGLPTDCPQRDERLGWTGDAQAFAATANVLFDSAQFWMNWLRDLSLDQTDDGVPSVVPDVVLDGPPRTGRAGWADAATIAPMASYEAYGDAAVLEQQLSSMRRWIATLQNKRHDDGLLGGEFQFGDWLDPDAPSAEPWKAKVSGDFVANAFFAHSARLTGRAAAVLGDADLAADMNRLGDEIAGLTWARWNTHALESQSGCAMAVELAIAPAGERSAIAAQLADLVNEVDGAVSTGFLGTPLVLPALSRYGHIDTAYKMLLRTGPRSWLYQIAQGATSMWERWDAILPDGSIHDGRMSPIDVNGGHEPDEPHMLSFNHYAYGAVVDWIYRNVVGLAPDIEAPGYRTTIVAPRPCVEVTHAAATIASGWGPISIDWTLDDNVFSAELTVPFGATAVVDLPVTPHSEIRLNGVVAADSDISPVGHGTHHIVVTSPMVADPQR